MSIKKCPICNNEFQDYHGNKTYCSKKCKNQSVRKVKQRPYKCRLQDMLLKYSIAEIGRMYGVSGNAVRFWCKQYDIDYSREAIAAARLKEAEDDLKRMRKVIIRRPHYDYVDAPITMKGFHIPTRIFNNVYEAADYVKSHGWTKSPKEIIIASIKRAILGERKTYLKCTWTSPEFVEEHYSSGRCKSIEEKERDAKRKEFERTWVTQQLQLIYKNLIKYYAIFNSSS